MSDNATSLLDVPTYGLPEAARYLRIPVTTLRYWTQGRGDVGPLVSLANLSPPRLSFSNLVECHVLSAMRGAAYQLRLPKIRRALETLGRLFPSKHPLLERAFQTDGVDLFIEQLPEELVNLSRGGQLGLRSVLQFHLQRIERDGIGGMTFFPFVEERSARE